MALIGVELFEGVDAAGAASVFTALDQLAVLVDLVDEVGPVDRRALRATVRRRTL